MTRQFRRTEEQFRASVRGLNLSPDYEPGPTPAPEDRTRAESPPAEPTAPAEAAPAPGRATRPGRMRRTRSAPSSAVERIVVPRPPDAPAAEAPPGPESELARRVAGITGGPTQAVEAGEPAPGAIPTGEMVAIHDALRAPEAPEASEAAPEPAPEPAEAPGPDERVAVAIRDGVKVYGSGANAVRAIDGVTHDFPRGQFTAIMGPSGSGKSTLLHCLAGLDDLTGGSVFVGQVNLSKLDEKGKTRLRRDKVGFVFQSYNLVPTLTAIENITLPMELAKRDPDKKWVNYLVQTIGLADRLDHLPSELSGGQQQRVAAARALAAKPEIVFADEPTGNLDSRRSVEILQFLRAAVDEFSQTIVMVTHDPVAASFADSVVFLADGRIVTEMVDPTVESVLDQIKLLEASQA